MDFNNQLNELYAQMGDRVAGFSENTMNYMTSPIFLITAVILGAIAAPALAWRAFTSDNSRIDLPTGTLMALTLLGAMSGIMVMAMGFIAVYGVTSAATHVQDAHRLQRPATQEAVTELNDTATEAARQHYNVERVNTNADDWTRMTRAHHDNNRAELTTKVEVTVDAERDAHWFLHYNPVTGDVSMSDAGDVRDAKRVTPHDVAK